MNRSDVSPKVSAPDLVRDLLRRAILDGEFSSGEQLRQEELADRFGTSRIPVREALRQLEAEGLVNLHPNRGAVVSALSLDDVLEMLEIRIALECRALRLAVPNMVDSDFDAATKILKTYDKEPRPQKWGEMNWRFHDTLYAPCNRLKLLAMIEANYGHVSRFIRTQVSLASGKEGPQREHYQILETCQRGDADRAAKLLEEHIVHTQKSLMAASRRARQAAKR
ncbi:transcriptional regulator, GntR family [Rhizobiales bacterium GAS191]|jgi:DNA-binding GntR family transcriptional regulator|nr:transcriptional regulator, GntR family [Rhizobiales bacterium GAS113]SEC23059.1 transcriptional regulator, GntR family [Rhizobiales bacterium GAS188]SED01437.1 transcriptional regulator, GntR family [Rhizobiales bacterium GAS191]